MDNEKIIRNWADGLTVTGEMVTKSSLECLLNRLSPNKRTKRIYVSGPMTGLPGHNLPAFANAAEALRDEGYYVFNPGENDGGCCGHRREDYLRPDIMNVLQADEIQVLPGFKNSSGALLELLIAKELKIPVVDFHTKERLNINVVAKIEDK